MPSVLYPGTEYSTKHVLVDPLQIVSEFNAHVGPPNIWNFRARAASHILEVEFAKTAWHPDIQVDKQRAAPLITGDFSC